MMKSLAYLPASACPAILAALLAAAPGLAQNKPSLPDRWVYLSTNMMVDTNIDKAVEMADRAAKAGYTGIVLTDSKFMRWDSVLPTYARNVQKLRQAIADRKLKCIACVAPIGYSDDLLGRDPSLAEGLPVKAARFTVRGGGLAPSDPVALSNGSFEQSRNNMPSGWSFADQPGKITFIDTQVAHDGKASLRMQDIGASDPQHGNARVCQKLKVEPFHYYHVSVWIKTKDFDLTDLRIAVLGEGGVALNYHMPPVQRTQDWKQTDIVFDSLEFSEVNLYLGIWGGKGGTIWWDDCRVEPAGLMNVIRRDGAPLTCTSEDGKTVYTEGKDFSAAEDPLLGKTPWPGAFSAWHKAPAATVPRGSRLAESQTVLMSYYFAPLVHEGQVMCCMNEPKVYDIVKWEVEHVRDNVKPDAYFMQHDEIRVQGWDKSCSDSGLTPAQTLAMNVRKCTEIIRTADPGKPVCVWSDMFDPFHNARKTGTYYLVKGDGPWYGSWEGLPKDVIVLNWNSNAKERTNSLKHFADLGNPQILAGYYDHDPAAIVPWLRDAAAVPGLRGVMYTTWQNDYSDLEKFAEQVCSAAK